MYFLNNAISVRFQKLKGDLSFKQSHNAEFKLSHNKFFIIKFSNDKYNIQRKCNNVLKILTIKNSYLHVSTNLFTKLDQF